MNKCEIPDNEVLKNIYGDQAEEAVSRYRNLRTQYEKYFGKTEPEYFSAPGRTEIIGNHTDHNGGQILAASITMDTIAAAGLSGNSRVTIISEGYPDPIIIDTDAPGQIPKCAGTLSLTAGMLEAVKNFGYKAGGFNAYVSTQVISSAGVSSSASFEMLICTILNTLFNDGAIDYPHYAKIGQYAENVYWEKGSGLMDQMACAVGGTVLLDFSKDVSYEKLDFSFDSLGCDMIIVNTGKGHADLSAEYSSIPNEMKAVARALGFEKLGDTDEDTFLSRIVSVRRELCNDRAIMRALHFYEECGRVKDAAGAIHEGDSHKVLQLMDLSGKSSWEWLQNCYVETNTKEEPIAYALALTDLFLKKHDRGICRINGGGFAGVIMCIVPKEETHEYVDYMTPHFGNENIHVMGIRKTGAVHVI